MDQFLGYKALLFQGLHISTSSLFILILFIFIGEWKLRVPVTSAACLQVTSGLARMVKGDPVSSILLKGK